jgi:hydrogenase expression/formation protein HypE
VKAERIPVLPETAAVCAALDVDPLALLASGALLVGASAPGAAGVTALLAARGVPAAVIAEVTPPEEGLTIVRGSRVATLTAPDRDEIARILGAG